MLELNPSEAAAVRPEPAAAAQPRSRWAAGALVRAQDYIAHHGVWAPGVRLFRNLSLRMKALVLLAVVGLPMGVHMAHDTLDEWQSYQRSKHRLASLEAMRGLSELARSISAVQGEVLKAELGAPAAGLAAALKADQERFDAMLARFDPLQWPASTNTALAKLRERREAVLRLATNASRTALPGHGGPRFEALADYVHEITVLRAEVARGNAIDSDAPTAVTALDESLAKSLPKLRWLMGRSIGLGAPLFESDDRVQRARRLDVLMAQAALLLDTIEGDLHHAMDHGRLDAAVLNASLRDLRRQLRNAEALAEGARPARSALEVAAASGLDRAAYQQSGSRALRATEALEDAAFASLSAWATAQAHSQKRHLLSFAVLVGIWLLVAGYLLACVYRVLAGGLRSLCLHLEAIGHGDLSQRPQGHGRDEIGRALNALSASIGHMSQLFGAVTQGVAAVSQASREVAGGNAGLSGRTAEVRGLIAGVADRAQACSASLDTCGGQVEQTAELVHGMRADGQRSRKAMGSLREGMARLQVKSREIGQVVGLVEAVAYQTKLLSINASVEAARAGEAGRGFAVVAQEVRALASRSEQAAQRIAGIVGASIDEIEACGVMAERTDEAVRRNEEKIENVDALMREAVRLTYTGRTDSQQVLSISRSVEESMAGNVRVVEQLAEASASLRTQGDSLKRSVQHFVFA